jgi:DNA-directed RNA polymerase specialized sigma24 family protein
MIQFTDDKACARAIESGNQALWEMLLDRVTDTILWVGVSWCAPSCVRGTCGILRQKGAIRRRLLADDCDCVIACYLHIATKHLPAILRRYTGETSLTEWCIRSLRDLAGDTHRRIDFARTGHICSGETYLQIRVPRPRIPECLRKATPEERELYRMVCRGKSPEEISAALRISLAVSRERVEALHTLLAENDWDAYIEMLQRQRLMTYPVVSAFVCEHGDETEEREPAAGGLTVEQHWWLEQAQEAVQQWLNAQMPEDRALLRLYLYEGRSAAEIVNALAGAPDAPSTPRQVYSRVETLLNRMFRAIPGLLAHVDQVQPERRAFVENLPCLMALMEESRPADSATGCRTASVECADCHVCGCDDVESRGRAQARRRGRELAGLVGVS